jgi:hypothetical protein
VESRPRWQYPTTEGTSGQYGTARITRACGCNLRSFAAGIARLTTCDYRGRHLARDGLVMASLMSHCVRMASAPATLSKGMSMRSAARSLIACRGATQRLAAANLRARPGAIDVAVITASTDAYLHATAAAVVEPVGCRLSGAGHPCLPEALDSARVAGA